MFWINKQTYGVLLLVDEKGYCYMWWTALHRGKKEVPIFPVPFADCMIFTKLYHHLTSVILSIKSILYNIVCNKWVIVTKGFSGGSVVKNPPANEGDMGLIPGSGRSPEGGNGNPFQYSCQENPMDREAGRLQSMGSQRVAHSWATKRSRKGLAWSHADRKWKFGIWTQSNSTD